MNTKALVIQTEAWAREELAAQKLLARLLERQEQAVAENDTEALIEITAEIQERIAKGNARDRRRREIVQRLGMAFGVAPETLTLGSIAERAASEGVEVENLFAVRKELRGESSRVLRLGRRIAAIARYHQTFLSEVLHILASDGPSDTGDTGRGESGRSMLLDARA